ncbi:MAG: Holliday junction branch migration protein RuvA [Candidatus Kryptonium sp.]|nr:Holliday junction branch migration protein RuvA [Candidatus Kryptonium sp.]MCX7762179.1 Holliday junction branch migration protein RuvA [Candidatus Kryptonium sp.]MDW8108971.1 Holliday junction branch migration protein RuvA [Candidatus Kryptonium sp.]
MIFALEGKVVSKAPTEIVIDVGGVNYLVHIPVTIYDKIGDVGSNTKLYTYLIVKDEEMFLYGFSSIEEREFFKMLISVSGIGPKMAQAIMSGMSVDELKESIVRGDVSTLISIPGVGKKTAERVIVELRDKIAKIEFAGKHPEFVSSDQVEVRNEALLALISLGFTRQSAEKAIRLAIKENEKKEFTVEELVKLALRHITSR